MEPTLLPPRESLLGEPRKAASLLFMSIGAQAQFSFDIRGAGRPGQQSHRQPKFTQPGQQSHQQLSPGQQSQSAVA